MKPNLLINVIGNCKSGKSETWLCLFEKKVKTGCYERKLFYPNNEFIKVFLINGSPEERNIPVKDIIGDQNPRIVLCSIQYIKEAVATFEYFINNNYHLYCHWLNPGYKDDNNIAQFDNLGFINFILSIESSNFSVKNGKSLPKSRVDEMAAFIYGWASHNNLVIKYH